MSPEEREKDIKESVEANMRYGRESTERVQKIVAKQEDYNLAVRERQSLSLWQKMKSFFGDITNQKSFTDEELLENIRQQSITIDELISKSNDTYIDKVELVNAEKQIIPVRSII